LQDGRLLHLGAQRGLARQLEEDGPSDPDEAEAERGAGDQAAHRVECFQRGDHGQPAAGERAGDAGDRLEQGCTDERADQPGDRRVGGACAAVEHVRRQPGADDRPGRQAREGEGSRDQPAPEPREGSERGDRERDPVDARHGGPFYRESADPCRYTAPRSGA
jgi:hypothetical protein